MSHAAARVVCVLGGRCPQLLGRWGWLNPLGCEEDQLLWTYVEKILPLPAPLGGHSSTLSSRAGPRTYFCSQFKGEKGKEGKQKDLRGDRLSTSQSNKIELNPLRSISWKGLQNTLERNPQPATLTVRKCWLWTPGKFISGLGSPQCGERFALMDGRGPMASLGLTVCTQVCKEVWFYF